MARLGSRIRSLFTSQRSSALRYDAQTPRTHRVMAEAGTPEPAALPAWTHVYPAGGRVIREGDLGSSLFIIVEGRVAVMREPEGRAGWTVGELGPGDFFGELALVTEGPRTASVMALERTVLLELSQAGLQEAGARHGLEEPVVRMTSQQRLLADALRGSPLLAGLSRDLQLQLGGALVPCTVQEGEVIITRGKPGDALYLLLRGRCSVSHTHGRGATAPYTELEEGAVFGEVSLLRTNRIATATVTALTPCTLLRVDRAVFRKFFLGQAELRGALVKLGLERLQRTIQVMDGER